MKHLAGNILSWCNNPEAGAIRTQSDLEESPSAYKDIDVVMEEQKDLVEILVKLTPLAVVKG